MNAERIARMRQAGREAKSFLRLSLEDRLEEALKRNQRLRASYMTLSAWQDASLLLAEIDERTIADIREMLAALNATPDA